jgi:hypothetical protein
MIIKANQTITKEMLVSTSIPAEDAMPIPKGRFFKPIGEGGGGTTFNIYRKHNKHSYWRTARLGGWFYQKKWFDVVSE